MKTYRTQEKAPYGMYLSTSPLDIRIVGGDGEAIEGKEGASYRRIPTLLAVALSPVLGGAFVMLFPLIVCVAVALAVSGWVTEKVKGKAEASAHLAASRWQPQVAYLQNGDQGEAGEAEDDPELAQLQAEVDARRETEITDETEEK